MPAPDPALTLDWVFAELDALAAEGLEPVLFGGWAKELLGAWPGGPHRDLDVLVPVADATALDAFIAARRATPVVRHAHKRVYRRDGHEVELFHVQDDGTTDFYGRYRRVWLRPLACGVPRGGRVVAVATPANIIAYERDHTRVQDALFAVRPGLAADLRRAGMRYLPLRAPFPRP